MRLPASCIAALAVLAALAGCAAPEFEPQYDEPAADSVTLSMADMPTEVTAGQAFAFRLTAETEDRLRTDHIGAHYWDRPVEDPTAEFDDQVGGCTHVAGGGDLPGTFWIECTLPEGTYQLWGHVRITTDAETFNYWSEPVVLTAAPADDGEDGGGDGSGDQIHYDLTASGVPSTATAGEAWTFTLTIEGPEGSSDHVGAHFWANSTNDPTGDFSAQAGGCQHASEDVGLPATLEVTCTIAEPGTIHLRGHLRLGSGDDQQDFWTDEHVVTVE